MATIQPAYQPEAGSYFNMMANADGFVSLAADASVVTASTKLSPGITVAKTGTGAYTVTLPRAYSFVGPHVQFTSQGTVALDVKVSSVVAQSFIVNTVNNTGVPTDASAVCGFFLFVRLRDSYIAK